MIPLDLRSDTITLPVPAMREAMARAEVGDDVFGDDPTVRVLEQETARILGKEQALFVPSGTMANQIAVRAHTQPGDEILLEADSHIYYYEAGGAAALSGVMPRCIAGRRGVFGPDDVARLLRPSDVHFAPTRLVCFENTHNRGGGSVWGLAEFAATARFCRDRGLATHLDGARLWNASVATGTSEASYAAEMDSVSVCFSKGLGAPVGSCLAGTAAVIERARRFRKQFGGGMRQAGIVAAGGLYALRHHRERLAVDHANARLLAAFLATLPNVTLAVDSVVTNIVRFDVAEGRAPALAQALQTRGVRVLPIGPSTLRAVTNLMVDETALRAALPVFAEVLGAA